MSGRICYKTYADDQEQQGESQGELPLITTQKLNCILRNPQRHQCMQCFVPLKSLTKAIALKKSESFSEEISQKDFKILCIPCLSGCTPNKYFPDICLQGTYKIWFCEPLDIRLWMTQTQWTLYECLQLFACAQKYGPHIDGKFYEEFIRLTSKNLDKDQLQQEYVKIKSIFFQGLQQNSLFNFNQQAIEKKKRKRSRNPPSPSPPPQLINSLSYLEDDTTTRQISQFFNYVQKQHPYQNLRKYPDNQAEFWARMLATSPLTKDLVVEEGHKDLPNFFTKEKFNDCFRECLNQKKEIQNKFNKLDAKYLEEYLKMAKKTRVQMDIQENQTKKLNRLQHPEVSKLLRDEQMAYILNKTIKLSMQRSQIMDEIKQKKKRAENARKIETKHEKRQRNLKQLQKQIQFLLVQSSSSPKPPPQRDPDQVQFVESSSSEDYIQFVESSSSELPPPRDPHYVQFVEISSSEVPPPRDPHYVRQEEIDSSEQD